MAAHRYWRVNITATNGTPQPSCAELLLRETSGGANVASGATAIAESSLGAPYTPDKVGDGNATTFWVSGTNNALPDWIGYDLGAGNAKDVKEIVWTSRGDSFGVTEAFKDATVQYSDNGTSWTDAWVINSQTGWSSSGTTRTFTLPVPDPAGTSSRWRVYVTAVQGGPGPGIAEIEMHTSIGGANVCTGGTASASNTFSTFSAASAFDSNDATYWYAGAASPQWIEYTFTSPQAIREFSIKSPPGADVYLSPQNFELQFFNGSSWVPAITRKYEGFTPSQKRTYSASYPTAAKQAWRVYVTAVQSENPGIGELVMRSTPGGANQCTGGTPFGSGSLNAGFVPANAFDATSSYWYSNAISPQWIGYQFPAAVDIVQYLITAPGGGDQVHAPKTFKLQYEDGAGAWVDSHSVTNDSNWSAGESRTFGATAAAARPVVFVCT